MKRFFALSLLTLAAQQAIAVDRYACDCQTGSHGSCVPGVDTNDGLSPTTPKQTLASFSWSSMAAGDRVLVCDGGSITVSALQIDNSNGTRSAPVTVDRYAPSTGATGTPIIRANAANDGFIVGHYFNASPVGHYAFRNVNLDGLGTGNHGLYAFGVGSLTLENVTIQRWGFGIEVACTNTTCVTSPGPASANVTLRNSTISRNTNMGFLGGGFNVVIERNLFYKNASSSSPGFKHNLYLTHSRGVTIRWNDFIDPGNADTDGTVCSQGNITGHGIISGVVIEENDIVNTTTVTGCGGISIKPGYDSDPIIAESMREVVVRGNRMLNAPVSIACAPRFRYENNRAVFTESVVVPPFALPSTECTTKPPPVDVADTGSSIRHNSLLIDYAVTGSITGYVLTGNDGAGTGLVFTGNLVRYSTTSGGGSRLCFQYPSAGSFSVNERNGCSNFSGWTPSHATLASAQAAGYDANSLNSDPVFAATPNAGNNWSMKLGPSSPYIGAGSATHGTRLAIGGWSRPTTPAIGAFDVNNP